MQTSFAPTAVTHAPPLTRVRAAVEVVSLVGGVLAIMWVAPFTRSPKVWERALAIALVVLLVASQLRERVPARALGFRGDNFVAVLVRLAPYLVGFALVLSAIGAWTGTLRLGMRFWTMVVGVPAWGLLQQYLLLGYAHRRLRVLFATRNQAVLATAALFGIMHLPNPTLTLVCALGGLLWAREYERSPNLFAHAVTHGIGSAFLANSLPPTLLRNMIVGYRYFG